MKKSHQEWVRNNISNITLKEIEDYLTNIFTNRKKFPERKIIAYRGCDYRGTTELYTFCGNEDCHSCSQYAKWFHEHLIKTANEYKKDS